MEKVEEAVQRTGLVPSAKIRCEQVNVHTVFTCTVLVWTVCACVYTV